MKPDGRDAELSTLKSELKAMTERCLLAEGRVRRYQMAFCMQQTMIANLCSADSFMESEIKHYQSRQ